MKQPSLFTGKIFCILLGITFSVGCTGELTRNGLFSEPSMPSTLQAQHDETYDDPNYYYILYTMDRLQGDDASALAHLERSIYLTPDPSATLYRELSLLYARENQLEKAIYTLEQATQMEPDNTEIIELLSLYYSQKGDWLRARNLLKRSIVQGESQGQLLLFYAQLHEKLGDFPEMVKALHMLREVETDNYYAYRLLGSAYHSMGKLNEAQKALATAIDLLGGTPIELHYERGVILWEMDRKDDARAQFKLAIDMLLAQSATDDWPRGSEQFLGKLLGFLFNEHDFQTTLSFSRMIAEKNTAWDWARETCFLSAYGLADHSLARTCFTQTPGEPSIQRESAYLNVLSWVEGENTFQSTIHEQLVDESSHEVMRGAITGLLLLDSHLKRVANVTRLSVLFDELLPQPADRLLLRAQLAENMQDLSLQEKLLKEAVQLDSSESVLLTLSDYYYRQKKYADIASLLRPRVLTNDISARVLNYYGYILVEQSLDIPEGGKYIRQAIAQDTQNPYYLDSLAWFYFQQHDYINAEIYITKATELLQPPFTQDDSIIFEHAGDILLALGNEHAALHYYAQAFQIDRTSKPIQQKLNQLYRKLDALR
ncbi:tetratricopeptide repeat protein [Chrysiogenes arsenatis]|uniref:tetratricopeptide repeat protein n=1 Tax=Chrysiogenes arsenatis TaxID=309797 RepID=UPI000410387A|nr:tetratricopeptide repeat protein [Chrysiogenes arsenatis]